MAYTFLQAAAGPTAAFFADTTGATFFVASSVGFGGTPTILDTYGNMWTQLSPYNPSATREVGIAYCVNPTTGTSHNFIDISLSASAVAVSCWTGEDATPADQLSAGGSNGNSTTSMQPGSITPSQNDELIICVSGAEGGANPPFTSIDSGFTVAATGLASGTYNIEMAYLIQTSAGAVNPTIALPSTDWAWCQQASFKSSGGTGGSDQPMMRRWGGRSGPVPGIGQSSGGGKAWG